MKKILFYIFIISILSSCELFYLPSTYQYGVDDPFAEIGSVFRETGNDSTNISSLIGVCLALENGLTNDDDTNTFIIVTDFKTSSLRPSEYENNIPILLGELGECNNRTGSWDYSMSWWAFDPNSPTDHNQLQVSPWDDDIYYLKMSVNNGSTLQSLLALSNAYIHFQIANYYDNDVAKQFLSDNISNVNYWFSIGRMDNAGADWYVLLTNTLSGIKITEHGLKLLGETTHYPTYVNHYLSPGRKVLGIKVNQYYQDWSLQGEGRQIIPANTTVRFIWEDIQRNAIPFTTGQSVWTDWPQGARIIGNKFFLTTTNTNSLNNPWDSFKKGRDVLVDLNQGKAVVTISLEEDINPSLIVQLVNEDGWTNGSEPKKHSILLPPPLNGAITVKLKANFTYTNTH